VEKKCRGLGSKRGGDTLRMKGVRKKKVRKIVGQGLRYLCWAEERSEANEDS